jgi:hypothetical protein
MWKQKQIIHLNSGSMVKDLFIKYGGERFKPSNLHPSLVGKMFKGARFITLVK